MRPEENSDSESDTANESKHREVDFSPKKEDLYRAVMADVDVDQAFLELVDNALDNWERVSEKTDPLKIELFTRSTDDGELEFVMRDDSGGVPEDELQMLFGLGQSAKDQVRGSVGAYGVGMKKAILRLADEATIATQHKEVEEGYGFSVSKEWLEDPSWTRPIETHKVPEKGVTEIRLRNLNFNHTTRLEEIKTTLRQTYEIFLGGGPRPDTEEFDFEIRVGDDMLEAANPVNWSYAPIDGLYPRQARDIEIDSTNTSGPVTLHLTVGLLQTADAETSGTDIYIQNRKVHHADKTEQGGYGVGRKVGEFKDSQHKRLKIIAELQTEGDARDLPWNSSKSALDLDSEIARQMFNWINRFCGNYYSATYQSVPQTILRPYGYGSPHAHESALGENAYDFTGREHVTPPFKPAGGYPETKRLVALAGAHAQLGIKCTDGIADEHIPAYEEHHQRQWEDAGEKKRYNGDLVELDEADFDASKVESLVKELDEWAKKDARKNRRYVGLEAWQVPRYKATFDDRYYGEDAIEDLETIDERPPDEDEAEEEDGTGSPTGPDEGPTDTGTDGDPVGPEEGGDGGGSTVPPIAPGDVEGDDPSDPEGLLVDFSDDQLELVDEVIDIEKSLVDVSPAERGDAIAERFSQLQAVLRAATPRGGPAEADD